MKKKRNEGVEAFRNGTAQPDPLCDYAQELHSIDLCFVTFKQNQYEKRPVHSARSEYAEHIGGDEPHRKRRDDGLRHLLGIDGVSACAGRFVGDIRSLSTLKRELRIRQSRLDKVLHGYGLFVCNGNTFYSPKLNEVMKPFEQRRARIEAYKLQKQKENLLKISNEAPKKSDIVSFEGKGEGKGKGTTTTNKEDDGASVPTVLAWERYVNELQKPIDKGKYKHEDVDPATGQRSYCGVPILSDAPPRPNVQAVWCEGKWVY